MRISDWSSDVCSSDLLGPRSLARLGRVDHAMLGIGMDRLAGPARRQRPRGVLLPVLMLPANLADLGRAVALGKGPERRPGLDRLQLLGIAAKDHLRAGPFGLGQYELHLARADHARLVDPQHVARAQQLAAPVPLRFPSRDRELGNASGRESGGK